MCVKEENPHFNLGLQLWKTGEKHRALREFEKSLLHNFSPKSKEIPVYVCQLLYESTSNPISWSDAVFWSSAVLATSSGNQSLCLSLLSRVLRNSLQTISQDLSTTSICFSSQRNSIKRDLENIKNTVKEIRKTKLASRRSVSKRNVASGDFLTNQDLNFALEYEKNDLLKNKVIYDHNSSSQLHDEKNPLFCYNSSNSLKNARKKHKKRYYVHRICGSRVKKKKFKCRLSSKCKQRLILGIEITLQSQIYYSNENLRHYSKSLPALPLPDFNNQTCNINSNIKIAIDNFCTDHNEVLNRLNKKCCLDKDVKIFRAINEFCVDNDKVLNRLNKIKSNFISHKLIRKKIFTNERIDGKVLHSGLLLFNNDYCGITAKNSIEKRNKFKKTKTHCQFENIIIDHFFIPKTISISEVCTSIFQNQEECCSKHVRLLLKITIPKEPEICLGLRSGLPYCICSSIYSNHLIRMNALPFNPCAIVPCYSHVLKPQIKDNMHNTTIYFSDTYNACGSKYIQPRLYICVILGIPDVSSRYLYKERIIRVKSANNIFDYCLFFKHRICQYNKIFYFNLIFISSSHWDQYLYHFIIFMNCRNMLGVRTNLLTNHTMRICEVIFNILNDRINFKIFTTLNSVYNRYNGAMPSILQLCKLILNMVKYNITLKIYQNMNSVKLNFCPEHSIYSDNMSVNISLNSNEFITNTMQLCNVINDILRKNHTLRMSPYVNSFSFNFYPILFINSNMLPWNTKRVMIQKTQLCNVVSTSDNLNSNININMCSTVNSVTLKCNPKHFIDSNMLPLDTNVIMNCTEPIFEQKSYHLLKNCFKNKTSTIYGEHTSVLKCSNMFIEKGNLSSVIMPIPQTAGCVLTSFNTPIKLSSSSHTSSWVIISRKPNTFSFFNKNMKNHWNQYSNNMAKKSVLGFAAASFCTTVNIKLCYYRNIPFNICT